MHSDVNYSMRMQKINTQINNYDYNYDYDYSKIFIISCKHVYIIWRVKQHTPHQYSFQARVFAAVLFRTFAPL